MRWVLIGCLGAPMLVCALVSAEEMIEFAQEPSDPSATAASSQNPQQPLNTSAIVAEGAQSLAEEKSGRLIDDIQAVVSAEPLEAAEAVSGWQVGPGAEEYTVEPEDVLRITVYEEEDLNTKTRVTSSGEITFPLLGRVAVAGLAVPQVQEKLTKLLAKDYLVNPQVQVFVETYHSRNVVVTGAVNKPGSYPISTERPTRLMEAIALAGGFGKEAAMDRTRIIRLENGRQKTLTVRVSDIIIKGDKNQDAIVRPNDIIFVPESFF